MHARELVEVAALVATEGRALIRGATPLPPHSIGEYWTASKTRFNRWARSLKACNGLLGETGLEKSPWLFFRPVIEEIFVGEVLARVWCAVLSAYDAQHGTSDVEPLGRSVLLGNLEARQRADLFIADKRCVTKEQAVSLYRLRRQCERWNDFLLGPILLVQDVAEFAIDVERARDFADQLHDHESQPGGKHAWSLALGSLRAGFNKGLSPCSPNADVNVRIAASIVSCFSAEHFEAGSPFRSLWLLRLDGAARDAERMVEELLR